MRRAGLVLGLAIVACCAFTQSAVGFVQVPGSPFPAGRGPFSLAFSPSGRLLAVANRGRYRGLAYSLSVFSVDQRTGALTQVPGSPFRAGSGPYSVVFSPDGGMLAVANVSGHSVSVFSVDQTTGALTQVKGSPFPTTGGPVAFSPDGGLLATPNTVGDSASVFSVDQRTGTLTPVPGSPFQLGIGSRPQSLAFSPVGGLLAIANNGEALSTGNVGPSVSVFSVDQRTGALTPVPGTPFPTGPGPYAVAFNRAGTLLAVSKLDNAVSVFSVDPMTGALSQVQGSPFPIAIGFGAPSAGIQSEWAAARGRQWRRHGSRVCLQPVGVLGRPKDRRVDPAAGFAVSRRTRGGSGRVQSGWGAARSRNRGRPQRVDVLDRNGSKQPFHDHARSHNRGRHRHLRGPRPRPRQR